MDEKIRRERFEKYGSFLFCPARSVLCFGRMTDAECKHDACLLDDPEYQALQKRIAENRRKNQTVKKDESPQRIRRQTKSRAQILEEEIARKEKYARACYRANQPRAGDNATYEIVRLRAKLRELKGEVKNGRQSNRETDERNDAVK